MTLSPDDATRKRMVRLLMPGLQVAGQLDLDHPRSLPQHRRYFARLGEVADSVPEHGAREVWAAVFDDLSQIEGIDPELLHEAVKRIYGITSIAFIKMGQSDACKFYNAADELLDRWLSRLQS
jgi:hypothetical protein